MNDKKKKWRIKENKRVINKGNEKSDKLRKRKEWLLKEKQRVINKGKKESDE